MLAGTLLAGTLLALYVLLTVCLLYILRSNWAYDDPFITFRYASNLSQGLGFVYNPGEHILSTTTPLFTLLLAVIHPVWPDLPKAAILIGAFSLAWGGLSLWKLSCLWEARPLRWIGLWVYPSFPLLVSTLGSEMPLYVALCLAAIATYTTQKYTACAALTALAVLTRPDALLLGLTLAFHALLFRNHQPTPDPLASGRSYTVLLRSIFIFAALTLPWFIFSWLYFGSPAPATLFVKRQQASLELSQHFAPGLITIVGWYKDYWYNQLTALLAALGITASLLRFKNNLQYSQWLLAAWTLLYFLAYSLLGVDRNFWYYAPLVPAFLAAAAAGIFLLEHFWRWLARNIPAPGIAQTGSVLLTGLICAGLALGQLHNLWISRSQTDPRYLIYRAAGEWLQSNTPQDAHTAILEIGIIGYYAQRPLIDFAGLLQPAVAQQLKPGATYEDAALWAIENYRPEYLVLHRGSFPRLEQTAQNRCTQVQAFSGINYDYSGNLDIYHCPPE